MIIDTHSHVWPEATARRALGGNIPDMELFGDGTVNGLREAQLAAGLDYSVCLAIANEPRHVEKANQFIGTLDRGHFIPFGTVHPGLPVQENLRHLRDNALRGVKLHAIFQRYTLDDPRLFEVLAALEGEFCVVIHVGAGAGHDGSNCTPAMVREIVRAFPRLDVIACHFGGYHKLEDADENLRQLPVVVDTSWPPRLADLDPATVRDVIRRHGVDKVTFASDWPTASPAAEIEAIRALGLGDEETAMVLGGNATRLFGMAAPKGAGR